MQRRRNLKRLILMSSDWPKTGGRKQRHSNSCEGSIHLSNVLSMSGFSRMSPFSAQQGSPKRGIGTSIGLSNSSQQQNLFESPLPGSGGMFSASPDHPQGYLSSSGSSSYLPNYLLGGTASPSAVSSLPNHN